jgi:hypothetical protein
MARKHYWQYLLDKEGVPITDVNVYVYLTSSESYVAFSETEGGSLTTNEYTDITTDYNGKFSFWLADNISDPVSGYSPDQRFRFKFVKTGVINTYLEDFEIFDPQNPYFLKVVNNLSDLDSVATARTNLGLGTVVIEDSGSSIDDIVVLENVSDMAGFPAIDGSLLTGIDLGGGSSKTKFLGIKSDDITSISPAIKESWYDNVCGLYFDNVINIDSSGGGIVFNINISSNIFDMNSDVELRALVIFTGGPNTTGSQQTFNMQNYIWSLDINDTVGMITVDLNYTTLSFAFSELEYIGGENRVNTLKDYLLVTIPAANVKEWIQLSSTLYMTDIGNYGGTGRFIGFYLKQS